MPGLGRSVHQKANVSLTVSGRTELVLYSIVFSWQINPYLKSSERRHAAPTALSVFAVRPARRNNADIVVDAPLCSRHRVVFQLRRVREHVVPIAPRGAPPAASDLAVEDARQTP